jgi:hypothetical protein
MKKLTELAIILVLFGISSWAQEVKHEVTVQGSGFFQKQTTAGRDHQRANELWRRDGRIPI